MEGGSSLECCERLKTNFTVSPIFVVPWNILTWKLPSADVKPANQFGSGILAFSTKGLTTGTTFGKDFFNSSDKPGPGGAQCSLHC